MTDQDLFREQLLQYFGDLQARVSTESGDWTVKGFIDIYRRIYTISLDTKVLSKVLELLLFPIIMRFADDHDYKVILAKAQNHYPDISLVSTTDESACYAVDVKTTYRTSPDQDGNMRVNGMTLGTFGGYFRARDRPSSSTLAYNRYRKHYVLGVIYSRVEGIDERRIYDVAQLIDIPSVARDFQFFVQEKYRIASDVPGSGNTTNIGSTRYQHRMLNGTGVFAKLGIEVFDDYWMNYRNKDMAKEEGFDQPLYTNLRTYWVYKKQGSQILETPEAEVETEVDLTSDTADNGLL